MNKIDTTKWKSVQIGYLFETKRGKRITKEEISENFGDIPVIAGGDGNNGILGYANEKLENKISFSNILTVSSYGTSGVVKYHKGKVYVDDKAIALIPKFNLTKEIALFLLPILESNKYRFSYGKGVIAEEYKNIFIKIPYTSNGDIDWNHMKNYIKTIERKTIPLGKIKISKSEKINLTPIKKWKRFKISDVFFVKSSGKSLSIEELEPGNVPYVGTSSTDNGVNGYNNYETTFGNCITIDSATVGSSFYQYRSFCSSDHVEILVPKKVKFNKYTALFIVTLLNKNARDLSYSYGRKRSITRIKREIIKLPVNELSEPDWKYMESFIKGLPYSNKI